MSNIDTLYQAWLSDAKELAPWETLTFDDYISECFACLQDPDDITDDVLYVCDYAIKHNL